MTTKADCFDCVEVIDPEDTEYDLEGYTLVRRQRPLPAYGIRYVNGWPEEVPPEIETLDKGDRRIINKIWCCRTCAWGHLEQAI